MEELIWLGYDINKLSVCVKYLEEAKKSLVDVDDTDEIYAEIHNLVEKVNDLKIEKEIEFEKYGGLD